MENKVVKYAPKAVIDALDSFKKIHDNYVISEFFEYIFDPSKIPNIIYDWIYEIETYHSQVEKEKAVINHLFGTERLQPERETRYIVTDGGGNFYLENGSLYIDSAESNDAKDYRGQGMTKEQADALVDNFGGSAVEIPETERETRYYVEFKDNDGITTYVRASDSYPAYLTVAKPEYKVGLYHETAVKAQALYGGTIEEIK